MRPMSRLQNAGGHGFPIQASTRIILKEKLELLSGSQPTIGVDAVTGKGESLHDTKQANAAPVEKPSKFYPVNDVRKPLVNRRKPKPTKLRASITPGTVPIILAGRFKGKRIVFLKKLTSGLLLVTGSFKINGVPLSYVIATSTKKKKKKGEGEFFEAEKEEKNVLPTENKDDQQTVDASLLKSIEAVPDLNT
ncbi:hypothetical protein LguiA_009800 [Lonicera macranthoides]